MSARTSSRTVTLLRRFATPEPGVARAFHAGELVREAAPLEGHDGFERSAKPPVVILLVQEDRHSVVDRADHLIAVGHQLGIPGAPFVAHVPHSRPSEDRRPENARSEGGRPDGATHHRLGIRATGVFVAASDRQAATAASVGLSTRIRARPRRDQISAVPAVQTGRGLLLAGFTRALVARPRVRLARRSLSRRSSLRPDHSATERLSTRKSWVNLRRIIQSIDFGARGGAVDGHLC